MLKNKLMPFCDSENKTLREVIVCAPTSYDVPESAADAVGFVNEYHSEEAHAQHEELKSKLQAFGCHVHDISSGCDEEIWGRLVNRIFVRDIAGVFGNKIILGKSEAEIRSPDFQCSQSYMKELFETKDLSSLPESVALEFGDFMILNQDCVLVNVGHRSQNKEKLAEYLLDLGVKEIGFVSLPQSVESLHLDVMCNILGENRFLAAPAMKFFPVEVVKQNAVDPHFETVDQFVGRYGFETFWLPDQPYLLDYTNFINLDKNTALINENARAQFEKWFPEHDFIGANVDELQNGAGSIRCMTLPIVRED
ncbi:arginine deiminase family protein [Pseudalkalibacillus sp. SCS-8]|uniref:arginine deiminase family protein n=1 Tax=Pseudalkalibacillus nanhaiensis TaxID=3115291 RepID=UPI0032DBD287